MNAYYKKRLEEAPFNAVVVIVSVLLFCILVLISLVMR